MEWEICLAPTLSLLLGYKAYLALHGFWGPELHPPVCTAVILVTEPSPKALDSVPEATQRRLHREETSGFCSFPQKSTPNLRRVDGLEENILFK